MNIRLFGCKIYISLLFIAMITLILFFDRSGIILFGLGSVLVHELGHIVFMAICRQMPDEIIMQPAGIIIKRRNKIMKYNDELIVALGGCTFNLIAACISAGLYYVDYNVLWMIFAVANASIGLFNLMPVSGLDGADILKPFLYKFIDEQRADLLCKIISAMTAFFMLLAGIFAVIVSNASAAILITAVYLVILVIINLRS